MNGLESTTQSLETGRRLSPAVDPDLLKFGSNLVTKLHVLMRMTRTYDSNNIALQQFLQESLQTINTIIKSEGTFSLRIMGDDLFFNDQRLRYSVEGFTSFKYLLNQWRKRLIGEIIFRELIDERTLKEFIYTLANLEEGCEQNAVFLIEHLTKSGPSPIDVKPLKIFEGEDRDLVLLKGDQKEITKKIYFETVGTIKEVITQIKKNQHVDVRRLKRLVQRTIHLIMEDESILLGLTTIKNYDEYTYNHSVNVSIYSLAIGRRLGFARKTLTDLGMTALLHDAGKSKIPLEVLNKPGALEEKEWDLMKRHPVMGLEIVLNLKQLGEINPRMLVGIFNHHMKNDLSGYPKLFQDKKVSLFGRIMQIADSYDAMVTPRVYKKVPYTPEQALAIMVKERGVSFDPILLKVFIGLVGLYPIGSLVLLNTHEMGVVYKANPESKWIDRPQVILLTQDGKEARKEEVVDLAETDENGHYKRSIIKTLDPYKYHIEVPKFLI